MPTFPPTRCPECGTVGTGRICAACREELWESHYHFIDPDGKEGVVSPRSWGDDCASLGHRFVDLDCRRLPDGQQIVEIWGSEDGASWPDTIARLSPIVYLMGATRRSISPEDRIGGAAPWTTSPASVA